MEISEIRAKVAHGVWTEQVKLNGYESTVALDSNAHINALSRDQVMKLEVEVWHSEGEEVRRYECATAGSNCLDGTESNRGNLLDIVTAKTGGYRPAGRPKRNT